MINSSGQIFLASSVMKGLYAVQVVNAIPKSEETYVRKAFNILVRTAKEIIKKHGAQYVIGCPQTAKEPNLMKWRRRFSEVKEGSRSQGSHSKTDNASVQTKM